MVVSSHLASVCPETRLFRVFLFGIRFVSVVVGREGRDHNKNIFANCCQTQTSARARREPSLVSTRSGRAVG